MNESKKGTQKESSFFFAYLCNKVLADDKLGKKHSIIYT